MQNNQDLVLLSMARIESFKDTIILRKPVLNEIENLKLILLQCYWLRPIRDFPLASDVQGIPNTRE